MSQYAHLSKLDPELAALLEENQSPRLALPVDIAAAQHEWINHVQAPYVAYEKARLHPGW
jgi:hypothetical protein